MDGPGTAYSFLNVVLMAWLVGLAYFLLSATAGGVCTLQLNPAADLSGRRMGFKEVGEGSKATGVLEKMFAPEFRNRLDATVHFLPLGTREIELVVDKHIDELRALVAGRKITIELDPAVRLHLVEVEQPDMHDPGGDMERLREA